MADPIRLTQIALIATTVGVLASSSLAQQPPVGSQAELATRTPEQLRAAAQARAANPNRPTAWWATDVSRRPDDWYRSDEGRRTAENILSWQASSGGWPLMNTTREPYAGDPSTAGPWGLNGALIKATVNEMRFMARAWRATGDERYRGAVERGLRFILHNQYPSGGWPHSVPPPATGYERYATYNDDMMADLMALLREAATADDFALLAAPDRAAAQAAFDRGLDFILKSQIVVDGQLTAWGQQHDPASYEPRAARRFEPAAISAGESAGVLELLMSLDDPSPAVVRAIEGGARWYERSRLEGVEVVTIDGDRIVRANPDAPPVWARFYEIGTNRPIFAGRDGIIRYSLAEVEQERRTGYGWYTTAGTDVLSAYDAWRRRVSADGA